MPINRTDLPAIMHRNIEFLPDQADMRIDGARIQVSALAPHAFQNVAAAQQFSGVAEQAFGEVILFGGKLDSLFIAGNRVDGAHKSVGA